MILKEEDSIPDSGINPRWLNPSRGLEEEGIEVGDMVVLKKKYFMSDNSITAEDPVQLHLLYTNVSRITTTIILLDIQNRPQLVYI